jgi:hypothetical protein
MLLLEARIDKRSFAHAAAIRSSFLLFRRHQPQSMMDYNHGR